MKNFFLTGAFFCVAIICAGQTAEKKAVRNAFLSYKNAILSGKGDEAVQHVDSRTIAYYSKLLDWVKHSKEQQVKELGFLDRMMVLIVRYRMKKEDLLSMDGKGLLIAAINQGLVGKNSVGNLTVGDVDVENDFAKGQAESNGSKAPIYFHFYKEQEQWKVDLTSLFPVTQLAMKKMVEDSGTDENEFIFNLLEMVGGKRPSADIWNSLL